MRARNRIGAGMGVGLGMVVLGALLSVTLGVGAASAAGERAGDAVVINGLDGTASLTSGGSATSYSLRLPDGAACPGDSANENYRVQSFIVPATDDPATLTYESQKPAGEGRWALYDVNTTPFAQVLTEVATVPGEPGRITPLPQLSFAVFDPGMFPDGRYRIGVACTEWSETKRYWDTEIDIVADPADAPAQLRWAVVGTTSPDGSAGTSLLVGLTVVGVAVAVAVVVLRRRFSPVSSTSSTSSADRPTPSQPQEQP